MIIIINNNVILMCNGNEMKYSINIMNNMSIVIVIICEM